MAVVYQNGKYYGRITDQAFGKSKNKGTPEIQIRFAVLGGINPADPCGELLSVPQGERTAYLYITEKTAEYVARDLAAIGYSSEGFGRLDPNTEGYCNLTGHEAEFYCQSEMYEDEEREKWSVARDTALQSTPLDAKEVRQLDALYGKELKKQAKDAPKETPPVAATEPVPAQEEPESIPF